jgi:Skp family chaperone for outer membrane proteins
MRGLWAIAAVLCLGAGPGLTQQTPPTDPQGQQAAPIVRSPVLTIDSDRLFNETLFGQRILNDIRAATDELASENARIAGELTAEEQDLTRRRPDMDVDAFRAEAAAFDIRVQAIRQEQDAKERALQSRVAEGRDALLEAATPVLGRLMAEANAAVVLERRDVFLSVGAIDITDEAIAAIDAALGTGE